MMTSRVAILQIKKIIVMQGFIMLKITIILIIWCSDLIILNITPKVQINFCAEYCKRKQTIETVILMKTKALRSQFPNKSRVREKVYFILMFPK